MKGWKRKLATYAAIGIGVLSWNTPANAPDRAAQEIYLERLCVNPQPGTRVVVQKGESEGIQEIRELLSESLLEEMWAFLPKRASWEEVGLLSGFIYNEQKGVIGMYTALDRDYLEHLFATNDSIVLYHFHPDFGLQMEDSLEYYRNVYGEAPQPEQLMLAGSIFCMLPSVDDLESMVYDSIRFYSKQPNGSIRHRLVSGLGVTEYYVSREFVSGLDSSGQAFPFELVMEDFLLLAKQNSTLEEALENALVLFKLTYGDKVNVYFQPF